jgi:general L-amino acid transport system permease protein
VATAVTATKPPPWRDVRVLRVAGQILFLLIVLVVVRELWLNLEFNLRRIGVELGFGFLDRRAGFGITEGIEYSPNDTYREALFVGFVNTLRIAIPGIVAATLIGLFVGVGRLSPNWLLRKLSLVYVEILRNTPVLMVIVILFVGVILPLPPIGGGFSIPNTLYLSNRGMALTTVRPTGGFLPWILFLALAFAAAAFVWRWRTRVNERTGEPHHRVLYAVPAFLAVAVIGAALTGPLRLDVAGLGERGFNYEGGFNLTAQYAAVFLGLVLYTSAFIAEIIRGSIQAVSKGQKEAAEALGLTPFQQLRFVVLPQAMRVAIPPLNSQYLNLTKNSTLGVIIGYADLANVAKTAINQSGGASYQIVLILVGTFLVLSLTISFFMNLLNRAVTRKGAAR